MTSAPIVRLVERQPNSEILDQLRILIDEAARGELVGLIVAGHYGGNEFSYSGAGSFCQQPRLAMEALRNLRDKFFATG